MKIVILQIIFTITYLSYNVLGLSKLKSHKIKSLTNKANQLKFNSQAKNGTTNATKTNTNTTNSNENTIPSIVDMAPYKPIDCSQTVILKAKRLVHDNDYATKKDAFVTMSALRINIFDQKTPDSLVNSKAMPGLNPHVDVLKGSKNCLFFSDLQNRHHNISLCIEDKNTTAQILDTFAYYQTCFGNVGKVLSKGDSLEKLLNTLNNPEQDLYKIPNFKIALTESLKETGVFFYLFFFIFFFIFIVFCY